MLTTSFFSNVFFLKKKKYFFSTQKILKPAPLDGKKFVDIRVFLQLARSRVPTCFKRVFRDLDITKKTHFFFLRVTSKIEGQNDRSMDRAGGTCI